MALRGLPSPPPIPGCVFLRPGNPTYDAYLPAYNARTAIAPALRAVCKTAEAVPAIVKWLGANRAAFAVRSGGHSFEGYCNSPEVVVDLRELDSVAFDRGTGTVTLGPGATIGKVQATLKSEGVAFVAGTCPTVGVAGHAMGGGYGLLSRAYGLACDNLQSIRLVDADGGVVVADAATNPDLFWASRGGGGGSLGIATEFRFAAHPIASVTVFGVTWTLPHARATRIIDAWQRWAPVASNGTTALLKIGKSTSGAIAVRCVGQSLGSEDALRRDLDGLARIEAPNAPAKLTRMSFWDAVEYFGAPGGDPAFQKEKSDYVSVLSTAGIDTMLDQLASRSSGRIVTILNAYGGAINALSETDTAFPHRSSVGLMIHYYSGWSSATMTAQRVRDVGSFYAAMRPYVPGKAYVNYCDGDLADWPTAYWGQNLVRLKAIKQRFDPGNLFKYAQSIPLR
jgi:FAD/FMN-containing dehydrogenase